jgi:hypothetical protein
VDKIRSESDQASALAACIELGLHGLVMVGGTYTNTDAAHLAGAWVACAAMLIWGEGTGGAGRGRGWGECVDSPRTRTHVWDVPLCRARPLASAHPRIATCVCVSMHTLPHPCHSHPTSRPALAQSTLRRRAARSRWWACPSLSTVREMGGGGLCGVVCRCGSRVACIRLGGGHNCGHLLHNRASTTFANPPTPFPPYPPTPSRHTAGDVRNQFVEATLGFDTATKVYAQLVGNMVRACGVAGGG